MAWCNDLFNLPSKDDKIERITLDPKFDDVIKIFFNSGKIMVGHFMNTEEEFKKYVEENKDFVSVIERPSKNDKKIKN